MNGTIDRATLDAAMERLGFSRATHYSPADLASAVVHLSREATAAEPRTPGGPGALSDASEDEESPETPESYPAALSGPLSALEVRICAYAHATGAEVRHRGGALLLRSTVSALTRALTVLESVAWDTIAEPTPGALRALHRAALIEGVTLGDLA